MKKFLYFVFALGILYACSTDTLETEELVTADAKPSDKIDEEVIPEFFEYDEVICMGVPADFCFSFPQATAGPNDKNTDVMIQLLMPGDDPESTDDDEFEQIFKGEGGTGVCDSWIFEEDRTYTFRYKIGSGGFTEKNLIVEDCRVCEESFSYTENGESEYTFFYTPDEDMEDALVEFTFAQSVEVSGLEDWKGNGQTEQTIMDLDKCVEYTWTVTLDKNCSGNSPNSNVWTDFKVNDVSKKNENTPNLTQSCN